MNVKVLLYAGLVLASALVLREMFPKTINVLQPPHIVTVHDTVSKIDTLRLTQMVEKLKVDTTYIERETVSRPETVTVVPPFAGVTALLVAKNVGDTSYALMKAIEPVDSGKYTIRDKIYSFYTPGPLAAMKVYGDSGVKIAFYHPPKPNCEFSCKTKLVGYGAAGGILVYLILHGH